MHAHFCRLVASRGLVAPKPLSSEFFYGANRARPALKLELRVPQARRDPAAPTSDQKSARINIERFGKAPTEEILEITNSILSEFDVHTGGLQTIGLVDAVCESEEARLTGKTYGASAPAILPDQSWSAPQVPRPVWIDLWPWTYVSSAFYSTVHDALLRGNYPEVTTAPKGVWVKTGDWTMDGATNLTRMKAFWGAFWKQSGLDPARLPGAMGEGIPV